MAWVFTNKNKKEWYDNEQRGFSVEKQLDFTSIKSFHTRIKYPLFFLNSQHTQAFMDFIHTSEGAYMIKGAQLVFEQSPRSFSIEILLALYTEGMIPFNEEIFVKNLYDIEYLSCFGFLCAAVLNII